MQSRRIGAVVVARIGSAREFADNGPRGGSLRPAVYT
jgi:hypothetical protein